MPSTTNRITSYNVCYTKLLRTYLLLGHALPRHLVDVEIGQCVPGTDRVYPNALSTEFHSKVSRQRQHGGLGIWCSTLHLFSNRMVLKSIRDGI